MKKQNPKRAKAEFTGQGHVRAASQQPPTPDLRPQNPLFSKERESKVQGVYTDSPWKECGVLWLGFFFPSLSTLCMPAKGVHVCVGGQVELQGCVSFLSHFIKEGKACNLWWSSKVLPGLLVSLQSRTTVKEWLRAWHNIKGENWAWVHVMWRMKQFTGIWTWDLNS